jgi:hypothetical protein
MADAELDLEDDLLALTGDVSVSAATGATPAAWVLETDFYLDPYDRTPARSLVALAPTRFCWTATPRGISVPGKWGYQDERVALGTLTAAVTTTTATTFPLSVAASPGQTLLIDAEQVYVTSVATLNATVRRGVNGTTAATHLITAAVERYVYDAGVVDCCLAIMQRRRKGRDAGLTGEYGGAGPMVVTTQRDTERAIIREMLWHLALTSL